VVTGHFNVARRDAGGLSHLRPDIAGLQAFLDHDNHDLRARMKDFMNQPLYIPCVHRVHIVSHPVLLGVNM
jgi:hypothetical protein